MNMSKPSNSVKDSWNAAHYKQLKLSVNTDLAAEFKVACADKGISMASVLSEFMADYCQMPLKAPTTGKPFDTRRKRRNAVKNIIAQLEQLVLAEESYRDNIPENLQGSMRYDAAQQSLDQLQEAVGLLEEAY